MRSCWRIFSHLTQHWCRARLHGGSAWPVLLVDLMVPLHYMHVHPSVPTTSTLPLPHRVAAVGDGWIELDRELPFDSESLVCPFVLRCVGQMCVFTAGEAVHAASCHLPPHLPAPCTLL